MVILWLLVLVVKRNVNMWFLKRMVRKLNGLWIMLMGSG